MPPNTRSALSAPAVALIARAPLPRPPHAPLPDPVVYWLDYHTAPVRLLPVLRQHQRPTMVVTDHVSPAVAVLVPACPHLRILCTPAVVQARMSTLLALLPHLHGGPLILDQTPLRGSRGSWQAVHDAA